MNSKVCSQDTIFPLKITFLLTKLFQNCPTSFYNCCLVGDQKFHCSGVSTMYYFIYYDLVHTHFKEENYLLINGQRGRQACRLLLVKYTKKEKKYFCTLKIEMQVPKKLYQYIRNLLLLPLFLEDISNRNLELHQQHLHLP